MAALLAAMLALAGCGGGSSSSPTVVNMVDCDDGTKAKTAAECPMGDGDPPAPAGLVAADVKTAIEAYGKASTRQLKNPPSLPDSGSATAKVDEDGKTSITLRQRNGKEVPPMEATFPISGWYGNRFDFEHRNSDQKGVVFTNIEAPTSTGKTYDLYFPVQDSTETGMGFTNGIKLVEDDKASGKLTITSGPLAAYFKDFGVDKTTQKTVPMAGSKGKFAGVDGTYECSSATACTITINTNNDKAVTITGDLTFTPTLDDGAELSSIFVEGKETPDADYLIFGYWMSGSDQDIYINAGTKGRAHIKVGNLNALTTTAKYSGAAGGYYTHGDNAGEFAAKASLTAVFGNGGAGDKQAAGADHNGITGTISGFQATSGGADLGAWELTLKKATIGTNPSLVNGITTSPDAADGQWSARFFDLTDVTARTSDTPDAVAGQFTGNFGKGSHVAGGFAAELDE